MKRYNTLTHAQYWPVGQDAYSEILFHADAAKSLLAEAGREAEVAMVGGQIQDLFDGDEASIKLYEYPDMSLSGRRGVMVMWNWETLTLAPLPLIRPGAQSYRTLPGNALTRF